MRWLNDLQRISTSPEIAARVQAPSVTAATIVLPVRHAALVLVEEGRRVAALIPNARFVPLPGENHIMLADEPAWQRFLAETLGFLDAQEAQEAASPSATGARPFPELKSREREGLELIAEGLNNTEIATQLVLSPKTVRNHITVIFSKLEVETRAQAIVRAREAGLGRKNRARERVRR
jgi:DNA-binding CsgD family transcriptional regulator